MTEAEVTVPEQARPRRRRLLIVVALTVVLLGAVATVAGMLAKIGPFADPVIAIQGQVSIEAERTGSDTCRGQGRYADVHGGAAINVRDAQRRPLATGTLQAGKAGPFGTGCSFEFAMTVPAGEGTYHFSVAQRSKAVAFAEADLGKRLMLYYEFGELLGTTL
jgi:hypothetical protein